MTYTLENNTFEIDNGYLFDSIKQGNYYEATQQITNTIPIPSSSLSVEQDYNIGYASILFDSESRHIESKVNHLLDVIGTIGGSFELIHFVLLTIYVTLRNNLYFYTIINKIRKFQISQDEVDIKVLKSKDPNRAEEAKIPHNTKKFDDSGHKTIHTTFHQHQTFETNRGVRGYLDVLKKSIARRK